MRLVGVALAGVALMGVATIGTKYESFVFLHFWVIIHIIDIVKLLIDT